MKILIFLKKWKGGVGVVVKSVKKELEKRGHKVMCISREEDLKLFSSIKNLFWLRKKYTELIKKENPDIIYTQDWSMALPLIFPYKKYNNKHFCCFQGIQPGKGAVIQKIIGYLMGRKLIVVGNSLKKKFPKSILIYNGIDFEEFEPNKKIKKIKNSVGFVNWKTNDYNYEKIKKAVKDANKKLFAAENIPYEQMPKFYQKLEYFISLPPKCTGFNMSWIEAIACGVPKIIGNNAGIGGKLNINKVKFSISDSLKKAKKKNYRKEILNGEFNLKKNIRKLIKIFEDKNE